MSYVAITQAVIKQYRTSFFEKLYLALRDEGIGLKILYGAPPMAELTKGDNVTLPKEFGEHVTNYWFIGNKLLYQPVVIEIIKADLVIVEQANKHLINYFLLLLSFLKLKKVAFWGHGRNRQAKKFGLSEWWKRAIVKRVDWWFAYTPEVAGYLSQLGVNPAIISNVQNSVDTTLFKQELSAISEINILEARKELGLNEQAKVGLYCGAFYADKHLNFLIESAKEIKKEVPSFELIIIGNGPDAGLVVNAARNEAWIHFLGAKFGQDKALYFSMADLFLHPGALGLAVLDAFCAHLPIITTNILTHGPEIAYIEGGKNGLIVNHDSKDYAKAVIELFANENLFSEMRKGAALSSDRYTVDEMVERFKSGIISCLSKV